MASKFIDYIVPTADNVRPSEILVRYIIAIALIFATVTFAHVATNRALGSNHDLAKAINDSGRQRMLSQRIQFMASAYISSNLTDETAKKNMQAAVKLFEDSHNSLVQTAKTISAPGEALYDGYLGKTGANLDQTSKQFIANAHALLKTNKTNFQPANQTFWAFNSETLLRDLNAAVGKFEALSIAASEKAESLAFKSYVAAVVVLLFELIFIFVPAHFTIREILLRRDLDEKMA